MDAIYGGMKKSVWGKNLLIFMKAITARQNHRFGSLLPTADKTQEVEKEMGKISVFNINNKNSLDGFRLPPREGYQN